jgi:hypothetical protein
MHSGEPDPFANAKRRTAMRPLQLLVVEDEVKLRNNI